MECLNVDDAAKRINNYLKRDSHQPYFVISDGGYDELKSVFADLRKVYISDFCRGDLPVDADLFIESLNALDNDAICFGLGEHIYLTGQENIVRTLQDRTFGRHVIFICRGITKLLEMLADADVKFRTNRICKVVGAMNLSVVKYNPEVNIDTDADNFSALMKLLETGRNFITVKSALPLANVKNIATAYDAIKHKDKQFAISATALTDAQWNEYLRDNKCEGYSPDHWRSFAFGFEHQMPDPYLQHVYNISATYEKYRRNLFFALIDVKDEHFDEWYQLRKKVIKNISTHYLQEYIDYLETNSAADGGIIRYLTDNTPQECHAMIRAVQGNAKIPDDFTNNFPAMNDYLADYDFGDKTITEYFRRYKKIKLCNIDDSEFKAHVNELALKRPCNDFETRRAILDKADRSAKLYWLDALGVEFAGYIQRRASDANIFTKIEIARADLPTLTSQNKYFYEDWGGDKFAKNQRLDELNHSSARDSVPIYICEELAIIDDVIDEIKDSLNNNDCAKVILTSDHGASRLAVMYGRENKYKMQTVGEHSGRCCPVNDIDEKPNCATEENGYWVLANYDRFSGGRMYSIEVHGGATIEEVLVPVIEFSLSAENIPADVAVKKNSPLKKVDDGIDWLEGGD